MTLGRNLRTGSRAALYAVLGGAALLVVVIALSVMWTFGLGWFSVTTADFRGNVSAVEQTKANGAFRRAAYTGFFDQCAAVQATEVRIDRFTSRVQRDPTNDDAQTNLDAVVATRADLVTKYNADATDSRYGPAPFRDSRLPYQIPLHYDPEVPTQCAA